MLVPNREIRPAPTYGSLPTKIGAGQCQVVFAGSKRACMGVNSKGVRQQKRKSKICWGRFLFRSMLTLDSGCSVLSSTLTSGVKSLLDWIIEARSQQ